MAAQTIDDVISALNTIVQQSHDKASRLGYFAALYRRVTLAVRDGIAHGSFQPFSRREHEAESSYTFEALHDRRHSSAGSRTRRHRSSSCAPNRLLRDRGQTEGTRRNAGLRCDNADLLILQQLLSGMNAHINLDLGIASAQVSPGDQLPQLKPDFDAINAVLGDLVGTVASEIAAVSPLIGDLEKIGLRSETSLVNFNMTAARDAAWFIAERLASEPSFLHDVTIDGLDLAVSIEGRAILYPPVGGEGLKVIQQAEVKDVRRVIEVLSQGNAPCGSVAATS